MSVRSAIDAPARLLESGPAAGVLGALHVAKEAGFEDIISLDMGGTSTDVAWIDGELERAADTRIGGVTLAVPALRVETIAAGGVLPNIQAVLLPKKNDKQTKK